MDKRNSNVIVLSGYARGGTNIVWNILQSHPKVCSPIFETGEVFDKSIALKTTQLISKIKTFDFCKNLIDSKLHQFKLKNLEHPDNKYIAEGKLYNKQQVEESFLCTKSVNDDIAITDLLLDTYPQLYFIALSRNGYALAESYIRRGYTAEEAGEVYQAIADRIENYSNRIPNFKMVKFEECLQKPFEIANELFSFCNISNEEVEKLRLKSKKTIKGDNDHSTNYGRENKKYWFERGNIGQILDPNINQKQIQRLSTKQIELFNNKAKNALKFFSYSVL